MSTKEYLRKYYQDHKKEILSQQKEYVKLHKESRKAYQKSYREKNKKELKNKRDNYLLTKIYGITVEDRNSMIKKQNNKCAICGNCPTKNRKLHIDHDHKTGRVRQLLCFRCNSIIGLSHENKNILKQVIEYLERHN